jgi:hypothetical protein
MLNSILSHIDTHISFANHFSIDTQSFGTIDGHVIVSSGGKSIVVILNSLVKRHSSHSDHFLLFSR